MASKILIRLAIYQKIRKEVIEVTQKKTYTSPELIRRGSIEEVTQGVGDMGTGDIFYRFTKQDGCLTEWGITVGICTGS